MMNVYYELSDCIVDAPGKYFVAHNVRKSAAIAGTRYSGLMANSERAWAEDETGVRYLKNRIEDPKTAKVDMKEFFWIKLKSINV